MKISSLVFGLYLMSVGPSLVASELKPEQLAEQIRGIVAKSYSTDAQIDLLKMSCDYSEGVMRTQHIPQILIDMALTPFRRNLPAMRSAIENKAYPEIRSFIEETFCSAEIEELYLGHSDKDFDSLEKIVLSLAYEILDASVNCANGVDPTYPQEQYSQSEKKFLEAFNSSRPISLEYPKVLAYTDYLLIREVRKNFSREVLEKITEILASPSMKLYRRESNRILQNVIKENGDEAAIAFGRSLAD